MSNAPITYGPTASPAPGTVTNAMLAAMPALTVKANATNASATPQDVAASVDGQVLRRSGTSLGFGTLAAGAFADNTVALSRLADAPAQNRFVMRVSSGAGPWEVGTVTDVTTALGLGTAAFVNTGASGSLIPLLSGTNTWGGSQTFSNHTFIGATRNLAFANSLGVYTDGVAGARHQLFSDGVYYFDNYSGGAFTFRGSGYATIAQLSASAFTYLGNTVFHAGNLGGTAITWTAGQTFRTDLNVISAASGSFPGFSMKTDSDAFRSIFFGYDATNKWMFVNAWNPATGAFVSDIVRFTNAGLTYFALTPQVLGSNVYHAGATPLPAADNTFNLGSASFRFGTVFASNGTINTSDKVEKGPKRSLWAAERRAIRRVMRSIGVFQWLSAVEAKGKGARLHVGVYAQEVAEAFQAEGLDPHRYGLFCEDLLEEEYEVEPAKPPRPVRVRDIGLNMTGRPGSSLFQVTDRDVTLPGTPAVKGARPVVDPQTGVQKTRLGVRYDQLMALALADRAMTDAEAPDAWKFWKPAPEETSEPR